MSTFTKIIVKDTNYFDRIQANTNPTIAVENTANLTTTFNNQLREKKINVKFMSSEFDQNQANLTLNEKIKITAIPSAFGSFAAFRSEIELSLNQNYLNHLTSIQTQQRTQTNNNADFTISYASSYNYYAQGYEDFIADIDEKLIGNYYVEKNQTDVSKIYNFNAPNKDFFKTIGSTQQVETSDESLQTFKNCILNNIDSVMSEVQKYPFYFNFRFETHGNDNLTDFINSTGMVYDLMDFYVNSQPATSTKFDLLFTGDSATVRENVTTRIFPFSTWLNDTNYNLSNLNQTKLIGASYRPIGNIEGKFQKLTLSGIFRNKVKKHLRTIEKVFKNEECSKQVLFYKVEKYINNFLGVPTQTLWFLNKQEAVDYYDTQVKYGTPYAYRLVAYTLVIGNSYQYINPEFLDNDGEYTVTLDVVNTPSAQVVEIPLIEFSLASIQNPPLKPQVSFSTKMSSDNNIKITLGDNVGDDLDGFVVISDADRIQERLMGLVANNYNGNNQKSYFNSDGNPVYYEIYRLSMPPKDYQDFVGFKIANAKQFFSDSKKTSSDVSINDYILSNTDYYYMIRSVNIHGHVSNPSSVYKVSLVQDADDSKINVEIYDFPKPKLFDNNKKFNSLLQVRPALNQIVFDNNQPSLFNQTSAKSKLNNIRLGDADNQIWGNTFKIRCTSTTTGKKIDFNVTFNIKTVNSEENFD